MKKLSLITAGILLSAGLVAFAVSSKDSKPAESCSTSSTCNPEDCPFECCDDVCCAAE